MKRFYVLEPLRGLAAVWVFLHHYHFSEATQQAWPGFMAFCRRGDLGVPMFFVISGICIATAAKITVDRQLSTGEFVKRRLRRIFPPYWLSMIVVAALPFAMELLSSLKSGVFTPPDAQDPNLGFIRYSFLDWLSMATMLRAFEVWPGATVLHEKFTGLNAVYWTLAIEVQFYLAVAVAVWARRWFYRILFFITLAAVPFLFIPYSRVWGIFLPHWPMFALGVGVFVLLERGLEPGRYLNKTWAAVLFAAATLSLLVTVFLLPDDRDNSHLAFAVVFAGALLLAKGFDPWVGKLLESKHPLNRAIALPALGLGAMSYTIYLLHGKLQFLSLQLLSQLCDKNSALFDAAAITGTLALCIPFFWFCERPFIGNSASKARHRPEGKPSRNIASPAPEPQLAATVLPQGSDS